MIIEKFRPSTPPQSKFSASRCGWVVALMVLLVTAVAVAPADAAKKEEKAQMLVERAERTLDMFASDPRFTRDYYGYLTNAKGLLVIPSMAKGGFIVGGSKGRGVLMARDTETDGWNGPAFYTLGGASIGLQAGGKNSEILIIVNTERGINRLLNSGVKLGGDLSVAVGTLGEGIGSKDVRADLIFFSRSKGFFGGASLEGSIIDVSRSRNRAYYGEDLRPSDILIRSRGDNEAAAGLIDSVVAITTPVEETQVAEAEGSN